MKVSKRVAWVDYAKGLAIIGVFVLHSNAPEYVIHVVDMFCMPAFFLLSGFVFFYSQVRLVPSISLEQVADAGLSRIVLCDCAVCG